MCGKGRPCGACRRKRSRRGAQPIGTPEIPVWRYGTVPPPPPDEPGPGRPPAAATPRTIGEYGGTVVLVAGLCAAVLAAWLLYLR
jgi:hypothetical protein